MAGAPSVGGARAELVATRCPSPVGLPEASTVSLRSSQGPLPVDPRVAAMGDLDNQDVLAIFNRLSSVLINQVAAAL